MYTRATCQRVSFLRKETVGHSVRTHTIRSQTLIHHRTDLLHYNGQDGTTVALNIYMPERVPSRVTPSASQANTRLFVRELRVLLHIFPFHRFIAIASPDRACTLLIINGNVHTSYLNSTSKTHLLCGFKVVRFMPRHHFILTFNLLFEIGVYFSCTPDTIAMVVVVPYKAIHPATGSYLAWPEGLSMFLINTFIVIHVKVYRLGCFFGSIAIVAYHQ